MKFRLEARVSSNSPDAVGRFLVGKFAARSVTRDASDWIVRAEVDSASARDANRELLSEGGFQSWPKTVEPRYREDSPALRENLTPYFQRRAAHVPQQGFA